MMKNPSFYSQQSTRVNHPGLFNCKGVEKKLYPRETLSKRELDRIIEELGQWSDRYLRPRKK
jgi:hypothetical protein